MEFRRFRDKLVEHFNEMTNGVTQLFEIDCDKDELWNLYLDSFPAGTNEIYRERRSHDCSCCRQFIKAIGNAVVIKDNKVTSIWRFDTESTTYQPVADALANYIESKAVTDIYLSNEKKIGCKENYEITGKGTKQWDHFYLDLPNTFVNRGGRSLGDIKGSYRDVRNVFKRSLDEITMDALDTVLELIAQNSLYRGEEWKAVLQKFREYKKKYDKTPEAERDNFAWEKSIEAGAVIGKIRNHSMGTLLVNISEDVDLELAVKKYEQITAPTNYKRPQAIFTKKMLEDAKKMLTDMGYMDSLARRFAKLDDITVNNILFSNKDVAKKISGAMDIFGEMEKDVAINPKKFDRVEEITITDFVKNVLPTTKEIEAFVENKHSGNMVSLIAPEVSDAKTMFKWDNGFSWAYSGNVADSMKERVKAAGGKVDGVLRFSIQWNESREDNSDLDAHCIEPDKHEIYYGDKLSRTGGNLDVDITQPRTQTPDGIAVENITYPSKGKMLPGTYKFFVNQYNYRNSKGFSAEIEADGVVHTFEYDKPISDGRDVQVAEVTLNEDGSFTIVDKLKSTGGKVVSKEVWGINTNQFVPVSVMMYSPNYWDEQEGIGNRHYFFMLKDCINPENPNGMFNEYLKEDLLKHKRVFEALGAKCRAEDSEHQLSGLGFSSTKRAELIVKVKGNTERILKIKF